MYGKSWQLTNPIVQIPIVSILLEMSVVQKAMFLSPKDFPLSLVPFSYLTPLTFSFNLFPLYLPITIYIPLSIFVFPQPSLSILSQLVITFSFHSSLHIHIPHHHHFPSLVTSSFQPTVIHTLSLLGFEPLPPLKTNRFMSNNKNPRQTNIWFVNCMIARVFKENHHVFNTRSTKI